ncbi:hypothetical protein [Lichenicola sp.]|uniref:hypothetical protein n=1 Tax=Lichenicola sp. TaxID=2804529 RepID=UPI003B007764
MSASLSMRRVTLVWSGFLVGEALLRVAIAMLWPSPGLIAATPLVWVIAPALLVGWSVRAGRSWSGGSSALDAAAEA